MISINEVYQIYLDALTNKVGVPLIRIKDIDFYAVLEKDRYINYKRESCEYNDNLPQTSDQIVTDYYIFAFSDGNGTFSDDEIVSFANDVVQLSIMFRSSYPIAMLEYNIANEMKHRSLAASFAAHLSKLIVSTDDDWVSRAITEFIGELSQSGNSGDTILNRT